ncbi:MBL fold metallo-hydrolase [Streptomyces mirabilis]|jgi:glyoxylase-like metal-dependent hydrolase (beta-lactamase superfamily II)|uniref:MBL fold metallo-hydrolase n=1 Tax=Streptomyces mirabilis TaxID=68239 RepID=UPI001BAE8CE4|nr:MBL fold metallo-hydrolase [Streptomyces mirabilis]QUW78087.1 MBL fold metallo-hydrolase [Streptomyces mirabilis]
MSRPAPTQVAPGVHRLGDHGINFYLIEGPDGLILIDSGVPAHLEQLRGLLAGLGHSVADVRAVLLTHGHLDHTGLAHTLQEAGAVIWIHERDAAILYDGPRSATRHAKPERSMLPYLLRRPSSLALPFQLVRAGAFTAPAVQNARVFDADKVLEDVPGAPQAVVLPGHTPGSAAYLFADRGLLFTGDALVTEDGLSGHTGPTIVSRCFTHDSRAALTALDRLDELTADLLLPGHGAPFTDGIRTATRQARQLGVR